MATAPPPPSSSSNIMPHNMPLFHSHSPVPPPPPSNNTPPPPSNNTPPPPAINTPPPPPMDSNFSSSNVNSVRPPSNMMLAPPNSANIAPPSQQNIILPAPPLNSTPPVSMLNASSSGGNNLLNAPVLPQQQKSNSAQNFSAPDPNIPPNQTIYINNINDKIKTDVLKRDMQSMFKQFGTIREIFAMKSFWRRGQVWIVFSTLESATKALNGMQGFLYHGKPMRINYAFTKSDIIAKEEGTFVERSSQGNPKKPRAIRDKEENQKAVFLQLQRQIIQQMQNLQQGNKGGSVINTKLENVVDDSNRAAKKRVLEGGGNFRGLCDMNSANFFKMDAVNNAVAIPNSTLFIENIAENISKEKLEDLFSKRTGFLEIRYIQSRNVAFVNFENEMHATHAMNSMQGHNLAGSSLKISYAKK